MYSSPGRQRLGHPVHESVPHACPGAVSHHEQSQALGWLQQDGGDLASRPGGNESQLADRGLAHSDRPTSPGSLSSGASTS